MNKIAISLVGACIAASISAASYGAEDYPTRPVRIVSPYAPGGTPDTVARVLAENLSRALKQNFFVENRTGANGMIASEYVASSPADGYTLLLASDGPVVIMPLLRPDGDVSKRLVPVNLTAESSFVLMARNDLNVKTIQDVVELAKKQKLTFGSAGVGSQHHLAGELLKSLSGIELIHVPYKGSADAMGDLIGKRIDLLFGGVPPSLPFIAADQVRAIAVTSQARSRKLPNVPTFDESGFRGYKVAFWAGIMAPAGTPSAVIEKLNAAIDEVVKTPEVMARFDKTGVDRSNLGPNEFSARLQSDRAVWGKLIEQSGLKLK